MNYFRYELNLSEVMILFILIKFSCIFLFVIIYVLYFLEVRVLLLVSYVGCMLLYVGILNIEFYFCFLIKELEIL